MCAPPCFFFIQHDGRRCFPKKTRRVFSFADIEVSSYVNYTFSNRIEIKPNYRAKGLFLCSSISFVDRRFDYHRSGWSNGENQYEEGKKASSLPSYLLEIGSNSITRRRLFFFFVGTSSLEIRFLLLSCCIGIIPRRRCVPSFSELERSKWITRAVREMNSIPEGIVAMSLHPSALYFLHHLDYLMNRDFFLLLLPFLFKTSSFDSPFSYLKKRSCV